MSAERTVASGTGFALWEARVDGPRVTNDDSDPDCDDVVVGVVWARPVAVVVRESVGAGDTDLVPESERVPVDNGVTDLDRVREAVTLREREVVRETDGDPHRPSCMGTDNGVVRPSPVPPPTTASRENVRVVPLVGGPRNSTTNTAVPVDVVVSAATVAHGSTCAVRRVTAGVESAHCHVMFTDNVVLSVNV